MDATRSINTLHNLALGRGDGGRQGLYSVSAQRSFPGHIPSCQPFSFVPSNRPDRTHRPFSLPTGSERSLHGCLGRGRSSGPGVPHLDTDDSVRPSSPVHLPTHAPASMCSLGTQPKCPPTFPALGLRPELPQGAQPSAQASSSLQSDPGQVRWPCGPRRPLLPGSCVGNGPHRVTGSGGSPSEVSK